jgi:hypothetical protein
MQTMWHEDRLVRAVKALLDFDDERGSNPFGAEGEKLIHDLRAAYFDLLTTRAVLEKDLQIFAAALQPHLRQREERFGDADN